MQYLHGIPPMILSAHLRGPFNNGWKNPWTRAHSERDIDTLNTRSAHAKEKTTKVELSVKTRVQKRKAIIEKTKIAHIASLSPEVSRTACPALEINGQDDDLNGTEVPPATAPSQAQHKPFVITSPSSGDTEGCVRDSSHSTNPFWLRRPEPERHVSMTSSVSSQTSPLRSRSRNGILELNDDHDFQLAPPTSLLRSQFSSPKPALSEDCRTVAPAVAGRVPRHDLIASPAPASSTGFVYRKIGNSKRTGANTSRPNLKHSNSPACEPNTPSSEKQNPQNQTVLQEAEPEEQVRKDGAHESLAQHIDDKISKASGAGSPEDQDSLRSSLPSHSSRQSTLSTQAAMLLAQIEFQESTDLILSSPTHRPWSQSQQDTPRLILPEPSPAITPLAVFSTQLDKSLLNQSVPRGPFMSTQDLFGAASPFAFSTVKKTEGRRRSGSRLALHPSTDEQSRVNPSPRKSPAPIADRIPLKAKDISTPLWSFVNEKASQDSFIDRSRQSHRDLESSQRDCPIQVDMFSTDGSSQFTDRFMRRLVDT